MPDAAANMRAGLFPLWDGAAVVRWVTRSEAEEVSRCAIARANACVARSSAMKRAAARRLEEAKRDMAGAA